VYLHHLPTFQILGVQFDIGESTANYIFHALAKNFERVIACFFVIKSKKNDSDLALVLEILKEFELIVDSYEQPRQRPTDYQEQKINKGGQAKKNTKKNQVIVMPSGK